MTKKELEFRLHQEPFIPFRVNIADGKSYEVTNPDLAIATDTRLFIVFGNDGLIEVVLRHVTSLQSVAAA